MRSEFEKDLLFLWDECAWRYQNGTGKINWENYVLHIQNHGNLGKLYPKYKFGVEGDTPSFLYVMPNGLNNPLIPNQVSWGGFFEWGISPDKSTYAYNNYEGLTNEVCSKYEEYFYPAIFNNFVARMDWAAEGKGNRNPLIVINENNGIDAIKINGKQGSKIVLDASKSYDLENNKLEYKWWIITEAGTYKESLDIEDNNSHKIEFQVPSDSEGKTIHITCEVTDDGIPTLTSYRRVIIHL